RNVPTTHMCCACAGSAGTLKSASRAPVRRGGCMPLEIDYPWVLLLLPLCLLPLLSRPGATIRYSSFLLLPEDRWSPFLEWALRTASAAMFAALLLGLSGPFRPATQTERIGEGAQIVLLLDR